MNFLSINGQSIHFQHRSGAGGRTFVFVNSLGTDFRIWDEVVTQLLPHGSVLRFDKPGHGLSEVPKTALTIRDYVTIVVGLLDALRIDKCVLVGLSIGGLIGQRFALSYPERLERLVLSNTAPQIGTADGWNSRIQAVTEGGMSAISNEVLERWFPESFRQANAVRLAGYRAMIEQTSPVGYGQACGAIRDEDLTDQIHRITLPTLCIGGTDDRATPPERVQAMADEIPNAICRIIAGAGHIPCGQMPGVVAQLILDFVLNDAAGVSKPAGQTPASVYETGMKTRRSVLGDRHVDRSEANKTDLDTDFQRYITESAWGMVWSRPGLTKRERSMLTIGLMAALGHKDELAMHIRATPNTGTTPDDVKEVLLQTAVYAGAPAALSALKIAKDVFAEIENSRGTNQL